MNINFSDSSLLDTCYKCGTKKRVSLLLKCSPLEGGCGDYPYDGIYDLLIDLFEKEEFSPFIDKISYKEKYNKKYISNYFKDRDHDESNDELWGVELNPNHGKGTGIIFEKDGFSLICSLGSPGLSLEYNNILSFEFKTTKGFFFGETKHLEFPFERPIQNWYYLSKPDITEKFLIEVSGVVSKFILDFKLHHKNMEKERFRSFEKTKNELLVEFDKNKDGVVDVVEVQDFEVLLKKHQKEIIDLGRNDNKNYVQEFIKLKHYLDTQKLNIQQLFDKLSSVSDKKILEEYIKVLKNQIHSYEVLFVSSLNMICVLIEGDLFSFYEIYEYFDKLGVFNSKYQNEMLDKLSSIDVKLNDVVDSIQEMSTNVVSGLGKVSSNINNSSELLSRNLKGIQSSIDFNTLITGIGVYQMYKINKNTKSLN
jgi:hypothetical protein